MNAMQAGQGADVHRPKHAHGGRSARPGGRPSDRRTAVRRERPGHRPSGTGSPPGAPSVTTGHPGPKPARQVAGTGRAHRPTSDRHPRRALGRYGEDLAARRLSEAGMRILERNWRCREGEIDIVAADGDALVVCEVKTRRAGRLRTPHGGRPPRPRPPGCACWPNAGCERHGGPPPGGVRIDLIGVVLPARGAPVVEHARGVA